MHSEQYMRATGAYLFFGFAITIVSPILGPYLKSIGIGDSQISLIYAFMPLVMLIFAPIVGRISDIVGRSKIIMFTFFMEIFAFSLYILSGSVIVIAIARMIDAFAIAVVSSLTLAKIEDNLEDKSRGRYAGISLSIGQIGKILGPVISGFVADAFFVKAPFIVAIFFIILAMFCIRDDHKVKKKRKVVLKDLLWIDEIRNFLSFRKLKGMGILGFIMHATSPALTLFLPILITEEFGLSYKYVGYAMFALYFMLIFEFYFGKLCDGKTYSYVLIGCFVTGLFMSMMFFTQEFLDVMIVILIVGLGLSIWNVSAWTLMSNIGEHEKIEGEVVGSYLAIAKFGAFCSFLVSGFIVELFSIKLLFALNGLLIVFGCGVAYFFIHD